MPRHYEYCSSEWPTPPAETLALHYKTDADQAYKQEVSYGGRWGYVQGCGCIYAGNCRTDGPNERIDWKVGPYRKAEDTTVVKVFFDNLKMTTNFSSADPEFRCTNLAN